MPRVRLSTVYLASIGLAAFLGVVGYFQKDPAWLLLTKILVVPVLMLAAMGLDRNFPASEARSRSWLKELERHFLNGILVSCIITIVTVKPDSTLIHLIVTLAVFLAVYVPVTAALLWRQHGRSKTTHQNVTDM